MSIRFPKMHVAESVVNRILNTHDELQASRPAPSQPPSVAPPVVPDPTLAGGALDMQLQQPTPPMPAASPMDEAAVQQGAVMDGLGLSGL